MMPLIDGIEFCEKVKSNFITSHNACYFINCQNGYKTKGLDVGADAYIEKPFELYHIDVQINNILNQRKLLQEFYSSIHYTGLILPTRQVFQVPITLLLPLKILQDDTKSIQANSEFKSKILNGLKQSSLFQIS